MKEKKKERKKTQPGIKTGWRMKERKKLVR